MGFLGIFSGSKLIEASPAQRLGDSSFVVALLRLRQSGGSLDNALAEIRLATNELKPLKAL